MLITLTRNIVVNDGKRGVFRKKGDKVEVEKHVGRMLIANQQAEEFTPGKKEKE